MLRSDHIEQQQQKTLTTKQAAELIGVNERTLDNWRSQGRGPAWVCDKKMIKIGRGVCLAYYLNA